MKGAAANTSANRLNVPTKLYGREAAVGTMVNVFEEVCSGEGRLLLVPGYSGVGKTSLVQQLEAPISERNGFFCQGKFNQYHQTIPYFAIQQAMTDLLEKLLGEVEEQQKYWKQELLGAMGELGQLLIDLSPDFEKFIGPQPQVPSISPLEARHRFIGFFRNILKVFCKPDHPLVLFIDDWQWADPASLAVFKHLRIGDDLKHCLLIASFRNNEVDETHPFAATLRELRLLGCPLITQEVKPLEVDDVRQFVKDTLQTSVEDLAGLTALIHDRTRGNPFFMHALVEYIYDFSVLYFDYEKNTWRWSARRSAKEAFPENVVELFATRFRQYNHELQKLLFQAACLGNRFSVDLLCMVSGQEKTACLNLFDNEIQKRFLLVIHKEPALHPVEDHTPTTLQFAHDRLQQAAYGLVPMDSLPEERLAIGRTLLERLDQDRVLDHLFEITGHMNAGKHLVFDLEERVRLLEMNIQAGRKAKEASAYSAALEFHREAGELLLDSNTAYKAWMEHHDLSMQFYLEWAETEFLEGNQTESEKHLQNALSHARTPLERAEAQRVLIVQYTLLALYPEAIAAARIGLEALDIFLPVDDFEIMRDREIEQVRAKARDRSVASFINMPPMSHPEMRKATQLLITMGPPCYRSYQRLWSTLVPKVVNLILQYGNMPEAGYSHTALAGLLIWVENDFALAREFTDLSIGIMTHTFDSPSDRSVFYLMIGSSARHWFHHMSHSSQDYADAYEIGSRFGNLQYAAYAFGHNMYCRFFQGTPLSTLRGEVENSLIFSHTRHNQWAIDLLEGGCQIIDELTGEVAGQANDPGWEEQYLQAVDEHHNIQVACIYKVLRSFQLFVMGDHERAMELSDQAKEIIYTVGLQGLLPWPEHLLIRFMILAALLENQDDDIRSAWDGEMQEILERLRVWARHCPSNYTFKLALAEAEMARIQERHDEAVVQYERAFNATQEGGFLQWQGVVNERTALFWESRGSDLTALIYWQQAYRCYSAWGGYSKTASIEQRFQQWLLRGFPESITSEHASFSRSIRDSLEASHLDLLRSQETHREETLKLRDLERQTYDFIQATARLREEVAHRKKVEQTLKETSAILQAAMDNSQAGIAIADAPDGRLRYVNDAGLGIRGGNRTELVKDVDIETYVSSWQIHHLDGTPYTPEEVPLARAILKGEHVSEIFNIKRPGDEWRTVFAKAAPILNDKEEVTAGIVVFLDITEQKQFEKQLMEAKESAEAANRIKSLFLANMSHEIRTPMNGIIGLLQLMQTTSLNEEQEEYAENALASSRRLTRLLSDILDLAKVEAGRMEISEKPFNLSDTVDSLSQLFTPVAEQKGLEFRPKVDPGIPSTLIGDELHLHQVMNNLIGNAIKFTESGYVEMEICYIPDTYTKQPHMLFIVSDSGIGIREDTYDRLFESFTQAEGDYTRRFQGAGLGLAISKKLVDLMGGSISVASEVGKGTVFYVSIPCKQTSPDPALEKEPASAAATTSGLRVLLAEDDPVSKMSLTRMLNKRGHHVHAVNHGREALAALSAEAFDAVVMDIQMPVMNGMEATRAVRAGEAGAALKHIPIIAMTAYAMEGDRELFLEAGMNGYLAKPLEMEELLKVIEEVMSFTKNNEINE